MTEHHSLHKDIGDPQRRKLISALQTASREVWALDDQLRRLCVDQARDTLQAPDSNNRDKQSAAAFVLKLSQFNLDCVLLMVEIDSIFGEREDQPETISVVTNKQFFGNDAHETSESATQNLSGEANQSTVDRSAAAAAASTANLT